MPDKKKELGYPEEQRSLIIMDTFKGQYNDEMKLLSTENNCELVIVRHNLSDLFQVLVVSLNQAAKNSFQTSSTHGILVEWANNCQKERAWDAKSIP